MAGKRFFNRHRKQIAAATGGGESLNPRREMVGLPHGKGLVRPAAAPI
jgi:hypothetical protein